MTKTLLNMIGIISLICGIIACPFLFISTFSLMAGIACLLGGMGTYSICRWLIHMLNHAEAQTKLLTDIKKSLTNSSQEIQEA